MDIYYENQQLPQPVLPSLPQIELLKGQTALVTGANSGIGRAIALALGRAGADVVINYVSAPEKAEQVAEEIRRGGRRAITAKADVSNEAEVQAQEVAERRIRVNSISPGPFGRPSTPGRGKRRKPTPS